LASRQLITAASMDLSVFAPPYAIDKGTE